MFGKNYDEKYTIDFEVDNKKELNDLVVYAYHNGYSVEHSTEYDRYGTIYYKVSLTTSRSKLIRLGLADLRARVNKHLREKKLEMSGKGA